MINIYKKPCNELEISKKDIEIYLGYYGIKPDSSTDSMIEECISEFNEKVVFRACFTVLPVEFESKISLGNLDFCSNSLKKNLDGCEKAYLFAATAGSESQRIIAKNSVISPLRGIVSDCVGSAAIEAFCDKFNCEFENRDFLRPRFSPGYGDLPLECQKQLLGLLDAKKNIGLSLNESLMMSPSKSVTAIIGIGKDKNKCNGPGCMICKAENCPYR